MKDRFVEHREQSIANRIADDFDGDPLVRSVRTNGSGTAFLELYGDSEYEIVVTEIKPPRGARHE